MKRIILIVLGCLLCTSVLAQWVAPDAKLPEKGVSPALVMSNEMKQELKDYRDSLDYAKGEVVTVEAIRRIIAKYPGFKGSKAEARQLIGWAVNNGHLKLQSVRYRELYP